MMSVKSQNCIFFLAKMNRFRKVDIDFRMIKLLPASDLSDWLICCCIANSISNPSDAEVTFIQCTRMQTSHVGIHWIARTEYSQMSTHMPGFQSIWRFFASFCIGRISQQQHKG